MRVVLRRVDPVSLAKLYAAIYALLMLLVAIPAGCAVALFGAASNELGGLGAGIGVVAIILYPVFGAIAGFVGGLLVGFIYNLVADRIGGVEMELDGLGEAEIL